MVVRANGRGVGRGGVWLTVLCLLGTCCVAACSKETDGDDDNQSGSGGALGGGTGGVTGIGAGGSGMSAGGSGGTSAMVGAGGTGAGGSAAGSGGTTGSGGASATDGGLADGGMVEACNKDLTAQPGQDECTAPLKPGDDRLCVMTIGSAERQFYIYAPMSFNPCKPATLIMDAHGLSETAEVHTGEDGFNLNGMMFPAGYGSGWRRAIQGENAIVVTPQGLDDSWTVSSDVPFLNAAADAVEAIADVDKEKVYVTGISMGGMMTVATGCDDSARWRGMVPVAMLSQACDSLARPTPFISFHATGDALTSYEDDEALAGHVAELNHCKTGPTADPTMVFGGPNTVADPVCFPAPINVGAPDTTERYTYPLVACQASLPESSCVKYTECDEGVEVVFCTINADSQPIGGHILYHNDTALQLASVGWKFLKKFWK